MPVVRMLASVNVGCVITVPVLTMLAVVVTLVVVRMLFVFGEMW